MTRKKKPIHKVVMTDGKRSVFPSYNALLKALYLSTFEATKKWTMPIRNWGTGLWGAEHHVRGAAAGMSPHLSALSDRRFPRLLLTYTLFAVIYKSWARDSLHELQPMIYDRKSVLTDFVHTFLSINYCKWFMIFY